MSMFPQSQSRRVELEYGATDKSVFSFFNAVYAWMFVGIAVTAVVGYYFSLNQEMVARIYGGPLYLVLLLGSVAIAWGVGAAALRISPMAGTLLFLTYAALIGVLVSGIFIIYPNSTLASAFLVSAGTFGGMSVYGYITKRDLSRMGSILIMCFWGLFLASIVNFFMANDAMSWIITYGILIVFIGLTAYDTQKLRVIAEQVGGNSNLAARYAIIGSLNLYVDFINIFLAILRIMGNRR